jgi:hypothetical protein
MEMANKIKTPVMVNIVEAFKRQESDCFLLYEYKSKGVLITYPDFFIIEYDDWVDGNKVDYFIKVKGSEIYIAGVGYTCSKRIYELKDKGSEEFIQGKKNTIKLANYTQQIKYAFCEDGGACLVKADIIANGELFGERYLEYTFNLV